MNFSKGQVFRSGTVSFEIVNVIPVTKHFSKLEISFLHAGYFSTCKIDFGSNDLEEAIAQGEIWSDSMFDCEKIMLDNNFDLDQ